MISKGLLLSLTGYVGLAVFIIPNVASFGTHQSLSQKRADLRMELGRQTYREYGKLRPDPIALANPFASYSKQTIILGAPPKGRSRNRAIGSVPSSSKSSSKLISKKSQLKDDDPWVIVPNSKDLPRYTSNQQELSLRRDLLGYLLNLVGKTGNTKSHMLVVDAALSQAKRRNDLHAIQKLSGLKSKFPSYYNNPNNDVRIKMSTN